ncbi:MAG: hypothetical protein H0U27_05895 [Nitrosopumilus sp.]|nr:hypothetical protein [Nitrosopumilus sp.]
MMTNNDTTFRPSITTLYQLKPETVDEQQSQKKCTYQILTGLQGQAQYFKQLSLPVQDHPENWDKSFEKINDGFKELKEITSYIKKDKINFILELNTAYNTLTSSLEQLTSLEQDLNRAVNAKQQNKLQIELNRLLYTFEKNENEILALYGHSKNELDRLSKNIKKYESRPIPNQKFLDDIAYRMRKDAGDYFANRMQNSENKDGLRIKRFDELKLALKNTKLQFNEVKNLGERLKLAFAATTATLHEKQEELSALTSSSKWVMAVLDQLDMEIFSSGFDEYASKRDLSCFHDNMVTCKQEANKMKDLEAKLALINDELKPDFQSKSNNKLDFNSIKAAVRDISLKIDHLETTKDDDLGDNGFREELEKQKKTAISQLQNLQKKIVDNYNAFRLNLHKMNHNTQVFNKLINIKAKLSLNYLDAESIRSDLRDVRKNENQRYRHEAAFKFAKGKIDSLHTNIHCTSSVEFYDSPSNLVPISVDFVSDIHMLKEKAVPYELSSQIAQLETDDDLCNFDFSTLSSYAKKIGLIYAKGNEAETLKSLEDQINSLKDQLASHKMKIKNSYDPSFEYLQNNPKVQTLKSMCALATEEINLMGKALSLQSTTYDDDFTKAYFVKSNVGKKFQEGILAVKGMVLGNVDTYSTYENCKSPFDASYKIKD